MGDFKCTRQGKLMKFWLINIDIENIHTWYNEIKIFILEYMHRIAYKLSKIGNVAGLSIELEMGIGISYLLICI